jgi:hypothetical protein
MSFLESFIDQCYPGSRYDVPLFSDIDSFFGFAIAHGGGLTLVYADVTNDGPWWVQIQSAVGVDIPDVAAALNLANGWNRGTAMGRYFCAMHNEKPLASIIFEQDLPGEQLSTALQSGDNELGSSFFRWVGGSMRMSIQTAAEQAGALGGRRLMPTPSDLTMLFMMASG